MTSHALISHTGSNPAPFSPVPSLNGAWEPAFFNCDGKLCPELPDPALCERYLDYLHHCIRRNPCDLLAHTRRVMLSLSGDQPTLVYAALTDLFTILGDKGTALRAGLLEKCCPVLKPEQALALQSMSAMVSAQSNILIVRNRQFGQPVTASALETARTLLEDGQVELAQNVLEQALPHDQDNQELTRELLEIYRRSRNRDDALRTRASLPAPGATTCELWDELLASLEAAV